MTTMNIERRIEDAMVTRLEARSYITTNSIPVRRYDDRATTDDNLIAVVACQPVDRVAPNYKYYSTMLMVSALNNSEADVEGDNVQGLYQDLLDEIMYTMTESALNTSLNNDNINIDCIVHQAGLYDGGDAYKQHVVQAEIFLTYQSFGSLYNEAVVVGDDLTLTTTRTGSRKSIDANTSAEVAENTEDLFTYGSNNVTLLGPMNGATNLVDTDLTNWDRGPSTAIADQGNAIYRVTVSAASQYVLDAITTASLDRVGSCQARLISGTLSNGSVLRFQDGGTPRGTAADLTSLSSSWSSVKCSVTSADQTTRLVAAFVSTDAVIEFRWMRAVDSTVAHPAFPDGSTAAASYGGDSIVCTPTYAASGYAVIPFVPYDWSDTGNPANAQPLIFESGSFTVGLDASGFYTTNGGAVSTKKPVADTLSIIIVTWDGTNHTITVDNETEVSASSAIVPSGTLYVGNTAAGSKEAHAAMGCYIANGRLTTSSKNLWNTGLTSELSTLTFR
jgi:hypothetical protein